VLIDLDGHVKLSDMGAAVRLLGRNGDDPPPGGSISLSGHPEFQAPEIFLHDTQITEACDWWSFGALLCEMLTGRTPFARAGHDVAALLTAIIGDPIELPTEVDLGPQEVSIVYALLEREPRQRLGARPGGWQAVLAHPWFDGLTGEDVLRKRILPPWVPFRARPTTQGTDALAVANHGLGARISERNRIDADEQLTSLNAFEDWGMQPPVVCFLDFIESDESPVSVETTDERLAARLPVPPDSPGSADHRTKPEFARRHTNEADAFDALARR